MKVRSVRLKGYGGLVLFVFCLIGIFYYLPAIDQQDCSTRAALLPLEYFRVEQWRDGRLQAIRGRHWPNEVSSVLGFTPDRGEWLSLSLRVSGVEKVEEGDTLFWLSSTAWEQQLIDLEGQLNQERSRLQRLQAGQKPESLAKLEKELELKAAELAFRQKQYKRAEDLLKDSLIASADYELAQSLLEQAEEAYAVAEAAKREAEAGVHPKEIRLQQEQIAWLERRIEQLRSRVWVDVIRAPFSGFLHYLDADSPASAETLQAGEKQWELWRTDSMILRIPIPLNCLSRMKEQMGVQLYLPDTTLTLQVRIRAERWEPVLLNNREVVYFLAKTPWFDHPVDGGIFPCIIELGKTGGLAYWKDILF